MAWRSTGSLSRSLSRVSSLRSPPSITRIHPPQAAPRMQSHRFSFGAPRNFGALGCTASFLLLPSVAVTCHFPSMSVNPRAFSELSHGMETIGDLHGLPISQRHKSYAAFYLKRAIGSAQRSA